MCKYVILILDNQIFYNKLSVIIFYNKESMSSSVFDSVISAIDRFIQAYNIEPKKYERKGRVFILYRDRKICWVRPSCLLLYLTA